MPACMHAHTHTLTYIHVRTCTHTQHTRIHNTHTHNSHTRIHTQHTHTTHTEGTMVCSQSYDGSLAISSNIPELTNTMSYPFMVYT